jgi:hypothetical protein
MWCYKRVITTNVVCIVDAAQENIFYAHARFRGFMNMHKKCTAFFFLLCCVASTVSAMEEYKPLQPAEDGQNHFKALPSELVTKIVIPYAENEKWSYNINPNKYTQVARLNKDFCKIILSIDFTKSVCKLGVPFWCTLTAKKYHRVNRDIVDKLRPWISSNFGKKEIEDLKGAVILANNNPEKHDYVDFNYIDHNIYGGGHTMLTLGIYSDNSEVVRFLLAKGANPNFVVPKGGLVTKLNNLYPLQAACGMRFSCSSDTVEVLALCNALLDAKANPTLGDNNTNALHHLVNGIVATRNYQSYLDEPAAELVSRFIECGANVNQIDDRGDTPIKLLYSSAPKLQVYWNEKYKPLIKVATALVDGGVDIYADTGFGATVANRIARYIDPCHRSAEKTALLKKLGYN